MKKIRIKCPAKINLTLEILNKREDGFHNIKSIMQLISLYDYLDIEILDSKNNNILLTGTDKNIPYDKRNLVYKAANLFLRTTAITNKTVKIHIEKNIPIAAGLAGGSTDAAGTIFGLNELFERPLNKDEMHKICAQLGSDLNVCLEGGCILATSRGENTQRLKTIESKVTLIKPKNLGISAKEAYTKYALKKDKPKYNNTEKMIDAINNKNDISQYLYNDLEYAVFDDYEELKEIKSKIPSAVMSGSGSTYFVLDKTICNLGNDYDIFPNLEFIDAGVSLDE